MVSEQCSILTAKSNKLFFRTVYNKILNGLHSENILVSQIIFYEVYKNVIL